MLLFVKKKKTPTKLSDSRRTAIKGAIFIVFVEAAVLHRRSHRVSMLLIHFYALYRSQYFTGFACRRSRLRPEITRHQREIKPIDRIGVFDLVEREPASLDRSKINAGINQH